MKKKTKPLFMRPVSRHWQRLRHAALALTLGVMAAPAMAGLPNVEPPSNGGGGGLMDTIKGYIQDGLVLGGLVVAAVAFMVVAMAAVSTFHEVREGKAGWAKFGAIIVVGLVLVVAVIWLIGKSAEILT
jgi:integrating conjugative element membrane protein (TIGR03745 family)